MGLEEPFRNPSKAHNQNKYSLADVKLSCCVNLKHGYSIINTRCLFGDNISNDVFDIVARGADMNIESLSRENLVKAFNTRYVDDQQSYALLQDALKSQEITQIVYEKIYGVDEAINSKKRVDPTKVVDNIGFTIDLIKESVRPMDKGLEKLFIVFFCIFKMSSPMSLRERQVVAGTAQAYCKCMKGMSEFIDPLHKFCVGTEFKFKKKTKKQLMLVDVNVVARGADINIERLSRENLV